MRCVAATRSGNRFFIVVKIIALKGVLLMNSFSENKDFYCIYYVRLFLAGLRFNTIELFGTNSIYLLGKIGGVFKFLSFAGEHVFDLDIV